MLAIVSLLGCARVGTPEGWPTGVVAGDTLYIGTMDGDFRALDKNTGETLWRFELRGEEVDRRAVYGAPAIAGDTLFIGGYDGILYAISLNGVDVWDVRVGEAEPIVGSPVVADDLVLVGSSDGNLYAFTAADGSWQWAFPTEGSVWSTPVVADGVAYFGSLDHSVYAVRIEDGTEIWRFSAGGAITATPVVANGRVYVGSFDSIFYAIDAQTGDEVWRFEGASKWFWGGAVATRDSIYAPSLDGNLYALDINSGGLRWTLRTDGPIVGSPAVVGDRIAASSQDGRVRLVRMSDGADESECNIGVTLKASLTVDEDVIFLGATDHSIRALRVKPNGNPDEQWVHFANEADPVARNQAPVC